MLPRYENLAEITESHLVQLVSDKVPEDTRLDYKRDFYDNKKMSQEWCKDISALANALGGAIIWGIDEQEGIPTAIDGIDADLDSLINKLDQCAQANIRPRVMIRYQGLVLASGRKVLLAATPQSRFGPHMTVADGDRRFYRRTQRDTVSMDVDELRRSFLGSRTVEEEILALHEAHVARVPRPASTELIHVIDAFPTPPGIERVDFTQQRTVSACRQFTPFYGGSFHHRLAFDGFVQARADEFGFENRILRTGAVLGYFRDPDTVRHGKTVGSKDLVRILDQRLSSLRTLFTSLEIEPPWTACWTMLGCRGGKLGVAYNLPEPFDHDTMAFGPITIPEGEVDVLDATGPWLHRLWNASGFQRCHLFDENTGTFKRDQLR